jgi:hypothetical protein
LGIETVVLSENREQLNNLLAFGTDGVVENNLHSTDKTPGGRELEES